MADPRFPGILGEIADAAGEEAASKIRDAFGGIRVRLPGAHALDSKAAPRIKVVEVVGIENARRIADAIVPTIGMYVSIPLGSDSMVDRRQEVIRLTNEGWSVSEIARRLRTTERTVYRIRRANRLACLSIEVDCFMRSSFGSSDLARGAVMLDVTLAGAAPAWVKVAPRGAVTTRDGRAYRFDPERLAARFSADAVDLPLDLDHAIARKASLGERADAIGWVKALQPRADGLYARVEWLATGLSVLAARTHRYVSPTFRHDDAGTATWLHSIALVAAPALSMPALASAFGAGAPARLDPLALAAAAAAYQASQAASGKPMRFADAVVAVFGDNSF